MAQKHRLRGRPIYVETGDRVVSIVPEVAEGRSFWLLFKRGYSVQLRSTALYVIDDTGVRKLAIRGTQGWAYAGVALGMLAAWLQYLVARRLHHG